MSDHQGCIAGVCREGKQWERVTCRSDADALERVRALAAEYDANPNWRAWGVGAAILRAVEGVAS